MAGRGWRALFRVAHACVFRFVFFFVFFYYSHHTFWPPQEKQQKREELKRLKNLKRQEIRDKLKELSSAS